MRDNNIEKLIEKYNSGESSIAEERYLLKNVKHSKRTLKSWFNFLELQKTEAPTNFNDIIWAKFEHKTKTKSKLIISVLSVAASCLFILAFYINNHQQEVLSYDEKAALLNQALEIIAEKEQQVAEKDIIYEDKNLIIYTTIE